MTEPDLDAVRARLAPHADVTYEPHQSPVGELLACATDQGLVALALPCDDTDALLGRIAAQLSPRIIRAGSRHVTATRRALDAYFDGDAADFDLPLDLSLTSTFQRQVLSALTGVRSGLTVSYSELATRAGSPAAVRATGTALARNPIPIVVPCHRVLQRSGAVGNYRGGPEMKRKLLELEGVL